MKDILKNSIPFMLSAVMLTVIQVPHDMGYLAWVAMVPFLVACFGRTSTWRLMWVSYIVSVVYWLVNVYWISYVTTPAYVLFCMYLGLYWPILICLLRYCARKTGAFDFHGIGYAQVDKTIGIRRAHKRVLFPGFLIVAILLVGAEAWQGIVFTGFNWRLLGHSQYKNLNIIQIADTFGQLGISFLIAMVNGFIAEMLIEARHRKLLILKILRPGNTIKLLIVIAAVYGAARYGKFRINQTEQFITDGPIIGSVQPNIPSIVKEESGQAEPILLDLIDRGDQCFQAGATMVVWPETIVLAPLNPDYVRLEKLANQCDLLIRNHVRDKGYVLTGAHGADVGYIQDKPYVTDKYNAAFMYRPDGTQDPKRYYKIHLVPFGEYIPFKESCPPIYKLIMHLSPYDYDYTLTRGTEYTSFEIDDDGDKYRFGVLICYEDTDENVTRRMAVDENGNKQADWLVNVSNDGWYVKYINVRDLPESERSKYPGTRTGLERGKIIPSGELSQRTVITVFRAVENRISIIRSVNTGISCLVDSVGRIQEGYIAGNLPKNAMKRQGVGGWFVDKVTVDSRVTLFSTHGPWIKRVTAAIFALVLIICSIEGLINRKKRSSEH